MTGVQTCALPICKADVEEDEVRQATRKVVVLKPGREKKTRTNQRAPINLVKIYFYFDLSP